MKILIIEDIASDRDLLIHYIEKVATKDIDVDSASCLTEAFALLAITSYDIVFLDLGLPESKGNDTINKLQSNLKEGSLNNETIVVVLTGLEDYSLAKSAVRNGVKSFIVKNDMNEKIIKRSINSIYTHCLPKRRTLASWY
tara:strand:+ start:7728 stop:8150 length:423 start_codon:yes stop_codon:yes gene_type:complete